MKLCDISKIMVALFVTGSAILLISCSGPVSEAEIDKDMITLRSDSLWSIFSKNGEREYKVFTPLMEQHGIAREPYIEYRKGIALDMYDDESETTAGQHSSLVADYAIFFENQELWEIKGNVVGHSAKGDLFETQQLFWNRKTKRIFSNVDTRITQVNGDIILGTSFESDEDFENWEIRRPKGKVGVDPEAQEEEFDESEDVTVSFDISDTAGNDSDEKRQNQQSLPNTRNQQRQPLQIQ